MKPMNVSLPELLFVAGTRALAGAGLGLLASNYLAPETRRHVGWTLFALGALTTVPILATVVARNREPLLLH
jgi:hypothetical protein